MPINFKWLFKLPKGRLSRRIGLWVFVSVIVIETIIFIPSFHNRKKELLAQIREISMAKISMMMDLARSMDDDRELLAHLKKLDMDPVILGGVLYRPDGSMTGQFGEQPALSLAQVRTEGIKDLLNPDGTRYDAAWMSEKIHPICTLIIRHDAASVKKDLMAFFLRISGLVVIISLFVTVGALVALEPIVITPILKLRGDLLGAGDAVRNDRQPPEFYASSVKRADELGDVISAFKRMYRQITDAIAERKQAEASLQESFRQVDAYSKALNKELEQGRHMQANFLPERLPSIAGWHFAAFFQPARQVSGDFYDIFDLPDNRIGIVVADVCDKGVGAALFMALFRSLIRVFSGQTLLEGMICPTRPEPGAGPSPDKAAKALEAVHLTNNYIVQNHDELGMFATLFFGVLSPATGQLSYINGGHEPILVIGPLGVSKKLSKTGPAVGLVADPAYRVDRIVLKPGEILFGYTDGATEARSPADRLFGRKRMEGLLAEPVRSAEQLLDHIKSNLFDYVGDAPQEDDITLLAVQRDPDTVE